MRAVRLAIVDDSTFVRKALHRIFESEPSIEVVGAASSGEELVANLGSWRPEVVTLDLNMPGMGGLATLDRIMRWKRIPVIILSTHSSEDAPMTLEALHRGAVDFIDKTRYSLVDFDSLRQVLVEKIHQVTGTKTADASVPPQAPLRRQPPPPPPAASELDEGRPFDIVLIGASTGGPPAIQHILECLNVPKVPIAIVQHMPTGFTEAFAKRLDAHLSFPVCEAAHGALLEPGSVYIAPAGSHLQLGREKERLMAMRTRFPDDVAHRPSVDILFQSAADLAASGGLRVLAVLLTGMGRDGAVGLAALRKQGAYTITQDEATSVVFGMPKVARDLGGSCEELPITAIGGRINQMLARR